MLKAKKGNAIIFGLTSFLLLNNSSPQRFEYVQGEVFVTLNENLFDFPLEIYGAYISISDDSSAIKLDSVVMLIFRPESRIIEKEKVISYFSLYKENPDLASQLHIYFPIDFIKFLKNIDAYWIERSFKTFTWSDTLLHEIKSRRGKKFAKSPNYGRSLAIKFKSKKDALLAAKGLNNLSCVQNAQVNEKLLEDNRESPLVINHIKAILPDSISVNNDSNIVIVTVLVDTLGAAKEVNIFFSQDKRLNPFALDAAKKSQFIPGKLNGKKVKMKTNVKFTF